MKKNFTEGYTMPTLLTKITRAMKIATLLIVLGIANVMASNSYSQKAKVSLDMSDVKLEAVLDEIENQSEFYFLFNQKLIDTDRKVEMKVKNEKIHTILDKLFVGTNVNYMVFDRQIVLTTTSMEEVSSELAPSLAIAYKSGELEGKSGVIALQQKVVSGTVISNEDELGLPGVNVLIKGSSQGTVTDINGEFKISVPDDNSTLIFSSVGYIAQEVLVGNQSKIDITLQPDITALEEIVVIGYGTAKKKDLTGSVAQVNNEDLNQVAATNLNQALQGRVAGVQVTTNSAQPGGSVSVRIRGVGSINGRSEPLYVVDGVPIESGNLNSINVNDIESIDILKDAASGAIYGARASNGVVIVTTKRGKKGKAKVSFNAYTGMQQPTKFYNMMNSNQFTALSNEAYTNTLNDPRYAGQEIPGPNPRWSSAAGLPNTDWQQEIFSSAPIQNYSINVGGGNDKMQGSLSAGYMDQQGVLNGSEFSRFNIRATGDYQVSKRFKFGVSVNFSDYSQTNSVTEEGFRGAIQLALQALPVQPVNTTEEGAYGDIYYGFQGKAFYDRTTADPNYYPQLINPGFAVENYPVRRLKENNILGLVYGEWEIIDGLKFRSSASLNIVSPESWSRTMLLPSEVIQNPTDDLYHGMAQNKRWNLINTLTYNKTIGKHNFTLLGGMDALERNFVTINGFSKNFPTPDNVSLNSGAQRVGSGTYSRSANMSYIGRFNYAYEDKYLLTANIRRDGSTRFGPNNKWGTFPSISAGWRISEEAFLKGTEWLSDLKLRASWGKVGNDWIQEGMYYSLLRTQDQTALWANYSILYSFGAGGSQYQVNGVEPATLPDENIKWEESEEKNIGIDLSLFNDKVFITADVFEREVRDMLARRPVPVSYGAPGNSVLTNFANMRNRGFELAAGYRTTINEFSFKVNANYANISNNVNYLSGQQVSVNLAPELGGLNAFTRTEEDLPIAQFYGYVTDGIYQNQAEIDNDVSKPTWSVVPGDRKYKDTDNDGDVDADDRVYLGNGLPKHIFGFDIGAEYKGFDFSMFFNGQAGVKSANINKRYLYDMKNYNGGSPSMVNSSVDFYENRWHGEGTSNTVPRAAYLPTSMNNAFSDFYVEDAWFLRLRNIQLGYSLSRNVVDKIGVEKLRVYLSAQNLLTITDYTGLDPEIGSANQNVLYTGADHGRYPQPKIYMLGVNLDF